MMCLIQGDFGECLDCRYIGLSKGDFKHPYPPFAALISKGGAPAYLPPEIHSAQPGLTAVLDYTKSDAFAVGVVLFECMTGRLPYGPYKEHRGLEPDPFAALSARAY